MRIGRRLLWLGLELLYAALNYVRTCGLRSPGDGPTARAAWLQSSARRVLRIFECEISLIGSVPRTGLLVCNHLSYLDILVLAALTPCRFVAKSEVKRWPVFGWFAQLAGTIFVERNRRMNTGVSAENIAVALSEGPLVVLFPEGTSSGGETVLPFKSSLLEPACDARHSLAVGFIRYELADGNVSEEVCYWKDMTLVPHLINLMTKRALQASVHFASASRQGNNRKELAGELHSTVLELKEKASTDFRECFGNLRKLPETMPSVQSDFVFSDRIISLP